MILRQLTGKFLLKKKTFMKLNFGRDRTLIWVFSLLVIVLPIDSWILPTHSRSSWYTGHHLIRSLCSFKIIHYVNVEDAGSKSNIYGRWKGRIHTGLSLRDEIGILASPWTAFLESWTSTIKASPWLNGKLKLQSSLRFIWLYFNNARNQDVWL